MLKHNVRRKVLIPVSLTFLVLILAFVSASYRIRQQEEREVVRQRYHNVQDVLGGLLTNDIAVLISTAEFIGAQRQLQVTMHNRDIDALLAASAPIFDRISERLQITHFYYHDVLGQTLLRVYRPEETGARTVPRVTLQHAINSGRPEAGLEIGSFGTFAQRMVFPWRVDGELLGYIELGIDIKPVLAKLKEITQIEVVIAIDKQQINRDRWLRSQLLHGPQVSWDFMPDKVISEATVALPRVMAARIFNSGRYGNLDEKLEINGRLYRAALLPITDAGQQSIGDLLMLSDISGEKLAFRHFLIQVITFSLVLSAALFLFAFRILGRVGRQLVAGETLLRQESDILAETNQRLQIEIVEREHAEQKLSSLNQHLEQRVAERTIELEQKNVEIETSRQALATAYQELQEKQTTIYHQNKMAGIGQLAAGIVHDINNPVGFVSHNLQIFERYHERLGKFDALQKQLIRDHGDVELRAAWEKGRRDLKVDRIFHELAVMVGECREGTSRISQIVSNLRTFSRSDAPKPRQADLRQCLDSTLTIFGHELRGKIRVHRVYESIPQLSCYAEQINQVFMNLLINATQAIAESGEIRIHTWFDNNNIYVSIADTGSGIPEDQLQRIFEPFFTTKAIGVGTGLGLSIVYDIVTRHHGEIRVESEVGKGTTFILRFPCANWVSPEALDNAVRPVNGMAAVARAGEGKQGE